MNDYPFKKGDLVEIQTSITSRNKPTVQGVIVEVRNDGFLDILIDGEVRLVHYNYLIVPKISAVKFSGGLK